MKNRYEIKETHTIIFIDRPDGGILEVLIDTEDLEKVKSFKNSWGATRVKEKRWLIKGTYRENKVKKNITLSRFVLDITDSSPVRYINRNQLDHRKVNLTIGYKEVQISKGNDYEIKDDKATLVLNRRNGTSLTAQIDLEDLQRVLDKGTWFAEWHVDFNNFLVQNVSYYYEYGKKLRKKITLHSFIKGINDKSPINHADGDTLNNCKSNLQDYSKEMINDYLAMEDDTVAIILRDIYGKEKGRALIDKEDLDRVKANGYTWFYYQGNGYPYTVANISCKRVYLHRLIMNTPEGMVVDHFNHETLDNRKRHLRNVTISENQQNRIGPRKGSRSGIRGVSWDERNQDWIVNVNDTYYGRFKDIKVAAKLAKVKNEETMPYLNE